MLTNEKYPALVWLDLEMTGLDPESERIIEIATVVTNSDLNQLIEGPNLVINQPEEFIEGMDAWNVDQHGNSGLIDKVRISKMSIEEAEQLTLQFLKQYTEAGKSPLCGNSISHDRKFLSLYMPELENFFHYRNVDVSSIKEVAKRWFPNSLESFRKEGGHRAMVDVLESIEELKYYKRSLFKDLSK
ncbi:MAG: oligoribonuclease [SAR86 cluster bacterium]|jgi:oligoribonuclease|nr:oligoribonuclease [SAR86 cluster bacterium]